MIARPPVLVGFLLRHCALGAVAGALLLAALVGFDVGGLGALIARAEQPWLVLAVLQFGFTVTFGSAAMGSAIFLLPGAPPEDEAPDGSDGGAGLTADLRPAAVRAPGPRRRGRTEGRRRLPFWLVPERG
ncbi:MAG: hypothetical protein ACFCUQ_09375 [Kiloniellales bacterium]